MKKTRNSLAIPRASRWFGICTVCLSLYIAYVTYLSQSGFLTGGMQTAAALCVFVALSVRCAVCCRGDVSAWPAVRPRRSPAAGVAYFGRHW